MAKEGNGDINDRQSPKASKVVWLTKPEAARAVGVSIRSIERLVEKGKVKQRFLKVVGRRPIAVLRPADVEKAKQETINQIPPAITQEVTALLPRAVQSSDLVTTIANSLALLQGKELKMFLTLDEAAELTGLTRTFLERLIHDGKLPAIRDKNVKVRRTDLLRL
jgi:excisionase family DNA binding protein